MRIIRYFVGTLVISMLLLSCKKDEIEFIDILSIEIPIEIPAGLDPIQTHFFPNNNVLTRLDEVLAANNITIDDIEAIQPRFAQIISLNPSQEFDFVRLSTIEIGNSDRDFIEAFYIDQVPNNEDGILDYIPNEVNLKSRFENSRINTELRFQIKRSNTSTFRANIEMSFFIQ